MAPNACPSESSGMSSSLPASIASAQAAAMSLASSENASMRPLSDCDIDLVAALDDLVFLQAVPPVDDMAAVLEMELPAVPGTDDVHVGLVEIHAEMDALVAD